VRPEAARAPRTIHGRVLLTDLHLDDKSSPQALIHASTGNLVRAPRRHSLTDFTISGQYEYLSGKVTR
jgi:hypothetical protein